MFNEVQYYFTIFSNFISYISFHLIDTTFSYFYINLKWYPEKRKSQVAQYWHLSYQYVEGYWDTEGISREVNLTKEGRW
jgi:hypothetical protein